MRLSFSFREAIGFIVLVFILLSVNPIYAQLKADMNADGAIDTRDITTLRDHLIGRIVAPGQLDYNDDQRVDIADLVGLIIFLNAHPAGPVERATPSDPTVPSDLYVDTQFLYIGPGALQTGVTSGTIEARRVAVIRGRVCDRDGQPMAGVTISILNHPEFGATFSRLDGLFDVVVNGGRSLIVEYKKTGYLSAQRKIKPLWRDWTWLPDVALVPLDHVVTEIDFSDSIQVARGSRTSDGRGERQATLLFGQGTRAHMVMADGTTQTLSQLDVRATEFTVGENGPEAMPAELPPTSGYTYCVEVTADEALTSGAIEVRLSQPAYYYVEDFIGFPVGSAVPTGWYDRNAGEWNGSDNGRVVKVLSSAGGLAELDTNGDGTADSPAQMAELGVTEAELAKLAELYPEPSQQLFRVPMCHFTPFDCNWPYAPPPDAVAPDNDRPESFDPENGCEGEGSIIEAQTQVLGQRLPMSGTPLTLNYRSSRAQGFEAPYQLKIPLSGETVPDSLLHIRLIVRVAGQWFTQTFPPEPNQTYTFHWDRKDAYGRRLYGSHIATITIGYAYKMVYYAVPSEAAGSWAQIPTTSVVVYDSSVAAPKMYVTQKWRVGVGLWDTLGLGLGGWTLSPHHVYDINNSMLYKGNGTIRCGASHIRTVRTVAGGRSLDYLDDVPATQSCVASPYDVSLCPEGGYYIAAYGRVRHVDPDGIIHTVAGIENAGGHGPWLGEGQPATEVKLPFIASVLADPKGGFYFAFRQTQEGYGRVCHIGTDGIIHTVAGGGDPPDGVGDGGPATGARINYPFDLAFGLDGSLYICERWGSRIRRVDPNGIIQTVAGTGTYGYSGYHNPEGCLATEFDLGHPEGITIGPDGSLYIADNEQCNLYKVSTSGWLTRIAGQNERDPMVDIGDGGPAGESYLRMPMAVAVDAQGGIYVGDDGNHAIRYITPNGVINTIAGNHRLSLTDFISGDAVPATKQYISCFGLDLSPDESTVYFTGQPYYITDVVQKISYTFPEYSLNDYLISSADGTRVFRFDCNGRHLETLHSVTGEAIYSFYYDQGGRLERIADRDGNLTVIRRRTDGTVYEIVAPHGQRTALEVDANGYLLNVTNPAGEAIHLVHDEEGLLHYYLTPLHQQSQYLYDDQGLLTKALGFYDDTLNLSRATSNLVTTASLRTALGRTKTYVTEQLTTGGKQLTVRYPDGCRKTVIRTPDGGQQIDFSNGVVLIEAQGPDPRFGMEAPITEQLTLAMPSGLSWQLETVRSVEPEDWESFYDVERMMTRRTINGNEYAMVFDRATSTITTTTPEGRQFVTTLDSHNRPVKAQFGNLAPAIFSYDTNGRLIACLRSDGMTSRSYHYEYGADGKLAGVIDPLGRQYAFEYDPAGRIIKTTLPGERQTTFHYDDEGKLTEVVPPDRPAHRFPRYLGNYRKTYDPPDAGFEDDRFVMNFDQDKQPSELVRPGHSAIQFIRDGAGRIERVAFKDGQIAYGYDPATGQKISATASDAVLDYVYQGSMLTSETLAGDVHGQVEYDYNDDLMLAQTRINDTHAAGFEYDNDGLLICSGDLQIEREAATGLFSRTALGDFFTSRTYNRFGEMERYQAWFGTTLVYQADHVHDALGRTTQKTEWIEGVKHTYTYQYDLAGHLQYVGRDGAAIAIYDYDPNDNRTALKDNRGTLNGTFDDQDRLLQQGETAFTYNNDGELHTCSDGNQTTTYEFDPLGNLRTVQLPGGTRANYLVDGRNRRIGRKIDGSLVQGWLYESTLRPIAELDAAGNVRNRFVYGTRTNVPDYMVRDDVAYRFICDQCNSVRLVVNTQTGQVVQRIDYDPFGRILNDTNPGFQPFGFAGGLYDPTTGLVHLVARDYDPRIGRFISKDPILMASGRTNLYAYADNDPINRIDMMGLYDDPCGQTLDYDEVQRQLQEALDYLESIDEEWVKNWTAENERLFEAIRDRMAREGDWLDALGGFGDALLSGLTLGLLDPGPALRGAVGVGKSGVNSDTDAYGAGKEYGDFMNNFIPNPADKMGVAGKALNDFLRTKSFVEEHSDIF